MFNCMETGNNMLLCITINIYVVLRKHFFKIFLSSIAFAWEFLGEIFPVTVSRQWIMNK